MEKKSCKLALLTGDLKLSNIKGFDAYLKEVWIDLISRITYNENDKINPKERQDLIGITKLLFTKYYSLPGIIGDRLFRVFDSNNNGVLEYNEFKTGMFTLFCDNYEATLRFIFDFYDFDGDGKISKEDIKIVLLYVTFTNDNEEEKNDNSKKLYEKKIRDILDVSFKNQFNSIKYIEFANIVEKINSDIYFMIYMFLLKKKPFSYKSIELYRNNDNHNDIINTSQTYTNSSNLKNNSILSNNYYSSLSDINLKRNYGISNNNIYLYKSDSNINSSLFNSKVIFKNSMHNTFNSSCKELRLYYRNNSNEDKIINIRRKNFQTTGILQNNEYNLFNQNLENTIFEAILPIDIGKELDNIQYNEEDYEDYIEDENIKENLESEKNNYNGYIYKLNNGKMRKIWFQLFYKDLFYYKNKDDIKHRGMHNLSGLFLKEEATKILNDKYYYSFSIIFPDKKRTYFCDDKNEFKKWKKHLRIAINYSNILQIYKMTDDLGSGSFSYVKLAINKVTNQKVAVKIMCKKKMSSARLESARTEIEIMKICQFPYIIKFIEAYENIDFIYIFMEYCPGGTLFDFLKKRNFKISEKLANSIAYKMCLAIYYFHSYGITHRDLKPENVLMTSEDDDADIRILDFGLGKIIGPNEKCSEPYGTVVYCAPEIIKNKPYTKNVDSWSMGIITYILLYGRLPFWDYEKQKLKKYIVNSQPIYRGFGLNNISDEGINFIQSLLIKDQNKRMTIKQALEHKWFQKYNKENLDKLKNINNDKKSVVELYSLIKKM